MDVQQSSETPVAVPHPVRVPVDQFVAGIRTISEGLITKAVLEEYLARFEIDPADIQRFKSWRPDRHTRNLIFRNEKIEVMVLCWNVGNRTPLHTHNGQLGWMEMLEGQLMVENFHQKTCNKPENQEVVGMDCLGGATQIEMETLNTEFCRPGGALNTVDKHQTIHRISNKAEWNQPAVSLHIYSLPIDSCVVFDMEAQRCYRRDLKYDTRDGVPAE